VALPANFLKNFEQRSQFTEKHSTHSHNQLDRLERRRRACSQSCRPHSSNIFHCARVGRTRWSIFLYQEEKWDGGLLWKLCAILLSL